MNDWSTAFVCADKAGRKAMLDGKSKGELVSLCKQYKLPTDGNTTNLKNRLLCANLARRSVLS